MKVPNAKPEDVDLRVLKSSSCPSLSGKSKLGYAIGCDPENAVHVRVCTNTGNGYFSKDWVRWDRVQLVLEKNGWAPITCHTFASLFQGRSVNTPGFLLAVLKHEGLVQAMADKRRCYERLDASAFILEINALVGAPLGTAKKTHPKSPPPASKEPPSDSKRASKPKTAKG